MGEHGQYEGLERLAPLREFSYLSMKRVLLIAVREHKKIATLGGMSSKAFRSQAHGPTFRLKSRMEFADVVQERERCQPVAVRLGQSALRCRRQAISDDGVAQQVEEDSRHIHRVMRERMLPSFLVGLAPGGALRHSVGLGSFGATPVRWTV